MNNHEKLFLKKTICPTCQTETAVIITQGVFYCPACDIWHDFPKGYKIERLAKVINEVKRDYEILERNKND